MARTRVFSIAVIALAVIAALVIVVIVPWRNSSSIGDSDPAAVAIRRFATAWQDGSLDGIRFAPGDEDAAAVIALLSSGLIEAGGSPQVEVSRIERVEGQSDRIRGRLDLTWDLGEDRLWSYETAVTAVRIDDDWLIEWAPSVLEPSLRTGEALRVRRIVGPRGQILDASGAPLTVGESTVVVGIRKSRTDDPHETARRVAELTSVPLPGLLADLDGATDDELVEVIRLPRSDYDSIRDEIQPLPGTVFDELIPEAAVPADYARAVIGTVGPAGPETVAASDGTIREGDLTGLSGLQASQNRVLAGRPGLVVEVVDADVTRTLETFAGDDGADLSITLDEAVQNAAEVATTGREHPTSLVAVRVSTGEILAIGNGGGSYNRALQGGYPPGSAFKIVTAYAAMAESDLVPDTIVPCPATVTVGKVFRNAEDAVYGDVPFRTDFAKSCNTAFVSLSQRITAEQLADTATLLGFGSDDMGLPTFATSVPTDVDPTEHAAQSLGQGRIQGTVLDVAALSASIAAGHSVQPTILVDDVRPAGGEPLLPEVVEALRSMMRSAVTEGTATVLLGLPGGEVMAKTGTAEFGVSNPPETHAWVTGYQGDVAFAVVVEAGGFGATVAGPVAADFLTALAPG